MRTFETTNYYTSVGIINLSPFVYRLHVLPPMTSFICRWGSQIH